MMSEPRRQHPIAAVSKVLDLLRANFITILVFIFVGGGGQYYISLSIIGATIVIFGVMGVVGWARFTYQVVDNELRVTQGVFVRKKLYLTKDRIQVIDISAGVLQQLFNLVSIEVKTAGSSSKEAKITAISRPEARRLQQQLRPTDAAESATEESSEQPAFPTYTLGMRRLIIAAVTSNRFGVILTIIGGLFSQLDQLVDEETMLATARNLIPASASITLIAVAILTICIIAWIFSFITVAIKFYGFQLQVRPDELIIERGLFETRNLTIPFNRIQAVEINESLLHQPFGYVSLSIESAGYDSEKSVNSTTLFPLLEKEALSDFLAHTVPDYHFTVNTTRPPATAVRRYLLRGFWVSLLAIVPAFLFTAYGGYSLLLLIPAGALSYAQYRDARIGTNGQRMLIRSRSVARKTALVHKHRVQVATGGHNPFQRRLNLGDFTLAVTSGNGSREFGIRELSTADVDRLMNWCSHATKNNSVVAPEKGNAISG